MPPDGAIRSFDGLRLLMKWEETADVLAEAVVDLKGAVCVLSCCLSCVSLCTWMLYGRLAICVVNYGDAKRHSEMCA